MSEPVLSVKNLLKKFGKFEVVKTISFDLYQGEILGLLGPNGAGKTTTIQMLLGVMQPDGGQISVFGQDLNHHRQAIMQQVNFSSAYIAFPGSLYVEENLKIFARLYNVKNAKQKIADLLELLDIKHLAKRPFFALSSGQKTRVVLAKALLNSPKLLLLDEPTASLDPEISHKICDILRRIVQEKKIAILYTSHNMNEVEELCDRVIFLHHGQIIKQGTPLELARQLPEYRLRLRFLDPKERMQRFLTSQMVEFRLDDGEANIILKEKQIPELLREANKLDFKIINIDIEKPRLEDVFLKISQRPSTAS